MVGGGFIGLEAAENLMKAGIDVTLVEQSSQVLPPMDYDMACQVHAYLRQKGLKLRLNASAAGFEAEGEGLKLSVEGEKPEKIEADFVLLAIGVEMCIRDSMAGAWMLPGFKRLCFEERASRQAGQVCQWAGPVSYTHLDVYKRQMLSA